MILIFYFDWVTNYLSFLWYKSISIYLQKQSINIVYYFYFGGVSEGYCWTRTGERQAARMRVRYLKAVLRQEVAYFDLHVTSTSEVITSVSNDSLVIQDCLSEKVKKKLITCPFLIKAIAILIWNKVFYFHIINSLNYTWFIKSNVGF